MKRNPASAQPMSAVVTRALRAAAGQAVPAIIVSARRDPEIDRACLELGVPMLEKPLRPEELQAMLQGMLV